jgi:hypothetical protein
MELKDLRFALLHFSPFLAILLFLPFAVGMFTLCHCMLDITWFLGFFGFFAETHSEELC